MTPIGKAPLEVEFGFAAGGSPAGKSILCGWNQGEIKVGGSHLPPYPNLSIFLHSISGARKDFNQGTASGGETGLTGEKIAWIRLSTDYRQD
jgi:hypothetical protein